MITSSLRITVALAALIAFPLGAQKPDTVSLRFNWPVGMTAIVEQEFTRVQQSPGKNDSVTVASSYRMRVLEHARGRLVVADSFRMGTISGVPTNGAGAADAQRVFSLLSNLQPSFVVSTDGEFVELSQVEKMKAVIDTMLSVVAKDMASMPPEFRSLMERATSKEALTASAAEQWNAVAGTWIGADWELGESYGASVEEPIPMFPGFNMPMDYEFSASERLPCTKGGKGATCVKLEMYSTPDTAQLRKFVAEFMAKLGPQMKDAASALQNMSVENEIVLIAEPRSLRPHSITRVKRVVVNATEKGKPAAVNRRVDIRTARYRYEL